MRAVTLIENTKGHAGCAYEHGLSIYAETGKHKLLFDTGASGLFLENAKLLGIGLDKVDLVILSHGHYDHGGGIPEFARRYPNTPIYMQKGADGDFYHGSRYIGLDQSIRSLPQLIVKSGDYCIDEELSVFAGVRGRRFWPGGNRELSASAECFVQDDFSHEQFLVIREGERRVLISGCAHNGILNVLDHYRDRTGILPDVVISGFHMKKAGPYDEDEIRMIRQTAKELAGTGILFYTGHCTGETAGNWMKEEMGDALRFLHSGAEIEL